MSLAVLSVPPRKTGTHAPWGLGQTLNPNQLGVGLGEVTLGS